MLMPHYDKDGVTVHHGDCLDVLRELPDASVDVVVTDPPYGLEFMGKEWDAPWKKGAGIGEHNAGFSAGAPAVAGIRGEIKALPSYTGSTNPTCKNCGGTRNGNDRASRRACRCDKPEFPNTTLPRLVAFQQWCEAWATECLRVLKPGGHLLAFGGTRTWHRLACAIEDAGFEVRDSIAWMYGSGFPKSLDVSKAIDRAAGAEREVVGPDPFARMRNKSSSRFNGDQYAGGGVYDGSPEVPLTAPATDDARTWQGWGTALKPGFEGVVLARKTPALLDRIGSRLQALEDECRQRVSDAAKSSAHTRAGSSAARTSSAPASAATPPEDDPAQTTPTGEAAGSFAATDTSCDASQANTCSNIVTSWKRCWAALSEPTSTSTTSTTSETTTDLTTLWSCLSRITAPSTLLDPTSPDGLSSLARIVDNLFAAAWLSLSATRELTATETATSPTPTTSQGAAGRGQLEPIVVARKPLAGTVAANVLTHGTGALNIAACRIDTSDNLNGGAYYGEGRTAKSVAHGVRRNGIGEHSPPAGRWPANVVLDDDQAAALDTMSGESGGGVARTAKRERNKGWVNSSPGEGVDALDNYGDTGGASRFFYTAKADATERVRLEGVAHPTVKPLSLMRWLVRLVTPPGGVVLEPFAGSGTTVEACILEGFDCVAIEREADYLPLILQRIHRRRDPVQAVRATGDDGGLFDLLDGEATA